MTLLPEIRDLCQPDDEVKIILFHLLPSFFLNVHILCMFMKKIVFLVGERGQKCLKASGLNSHVNSLALKVRWDRPGGCLQAGQVPWCVLCLWRPTSGHRWTRFWLRTLSLRRRQHDVRKRGPDWVPGPALELCGVVDRNILNAPSLNFFTSKVVFSLNW